MSCWATIVSSESVLSPFVVLNVDPDGGKQKKTLRTTDTHWIRPNPTKSNWGGLVVKKGRRLS